MQRRPRGDGAGGRASRARRRRGLRPLHARQRGAMPRRLRDLRPCPVLRPRQHAAGAAGSAAPRRVAQRAWPGGPPCARSPAAHRAVLPSAAGGRQSVRRQRHLRPDPRAGAPLGRAFRDGRHRPAGAGAGRADRGPGRHGPLQRRGARDHGRGRAGDRRRAGRRRAYPGRDRRLQRRQRLDLPPPDRAATPAALDRPADRARPLLDEPVRLVFRHAAALRRGGAPHHPARPSCSGRATGRCCATSSAATVSPRISASTCTARPRPIPRSRRRAAMRSTRSRRCRISAPASAGRRRRSRTVATVAASPAPCPTRCCPAWRRTS